MSKKTKVILISAGIAVAMIGAAAAVVLHGMFDYVNRCAHIKPKDNIMYVEGQVLDIDDLAEFTNYDERRIQGVIGADAEVSEDKQSVIITNATGDVTVCVFATNAHAPEWSTKEIRVQVGR